MLSKLSEGCPYVLTGAIRIAVRGKEAEVLDALDLAGRNSQTHIRCPYPSHDDANPSWRWDEEKGRAFCTCIEGSHSIFDVVLQTKGMDFDAAKIFVAESIGRDDLIRQSRGQTCYIKSDARSLLDPPDSLRDDTLVSKYLGFRLDVDPDMIPLPRTPFAGWRELPYYDPRTSNRKNAKSKHIGDYPCVVFGTVDANGGRHAHRIYVGEDGAGKADLGLDANQRPRPPKKSAVAEKGDNTAGRSVLWGNPESAPWIILCEGIETGAAIALAFRVEIEGADVAVAAAISAQGVEAFQPYPATNKITIAADRDVPA